MVRPARRTLRLPQSFVFVRLTPVRLLVLLALETVTVSMSRPAAMLGSSARVPVHQLLALESVRLSTVQSVPNAHSRMLLPATRLTLWLAPLANVRVTVPTWLPSYNTIDVFEVLSR